MLDGRECVDCHDGWWPTPDKQSCYRLPQRYIAWSSPYAVAPCVMACLGIALTSVVMATFVRHIDTPVVRAAGRELCFLLLSGFLLCFSMTFVLLARPAVWSCAAARLGIGLGFAVTYSALLTKTNRIARIFAAARRSAQRPAFISPRSQLLITALLVAVQLAISAVWFALEPPSVRLTHPGGARHQTVRKCGMDDLSLLYSLSYNMLLVCVCTLYAVKTRHIPENFNESKFIGFTMYTTCIIWLAFIPIYFGTLNSFEVSSLSLKDILIVFILT